MPNNERGYHRRVRIEAIARWSQVGVTTRRESLPIEKDFRRRLDRTGSGFFWPIALPYSDNAAYNVQVSYLLDAYDALPRRPDIAFDSAWKSLESLIRSATQFGPGANVTDRLRAFAVCGLGESILAPLFLNVPAQTCEYLFKRILGSSDDDITTKAVHRLTGHPPFGPVLGGMIGHFKRQYPDATAGADDARRGAMLLRRMLRGDQVSINSEAVCLDYKHRSHLLLSGLLYTARNERFHGASFSPFVSSAASLRTYCHPHFLFLCAYSLLHLLLTEANPYDISISSEEVRSNVAKNVEETLGLYGRHWLR